MHTRLETLMMEIVNSKTGVVEKIRCFLDGGSNRTFASTDCAKRCGFEKFATETMYLSSFGNAAKKTKLDVAKVTLQADASASQKATVNVFIKDQLVSDLNSYEISERQNNFIKKHNLSLADPEAALNGTLKIDMLLGQDCVHLITKGERLFLPGGSFLIPTWNGRYILAGPTDECQKFSSKDQIHSPNFIAVNVAQTKFPFYIDFPIPRKIKKLFSNVLSCITTEDEMEIVESFRALDALGIHPFEYEISPVLEEFDKSTTYDGVRYTVKLPFKEPQIKKLSNNFFQAFSRLMSGYKRRLKPKFLAEKEKYHQSFVDDLQNGILERVECLGTINEIRKNLAINPQYFNQLQTANGKAYCYLPHQCVYKQSTGKFRRVNDASAKPYKGAYSLNDCLEKGPDLMANILHILLGFRKEKWAAKADIEKAFPQVVIHPEHRDALRCLWYEGDKVWIYRFARLPFGLSCSPMLLAGVLQKHLAEKNIDEKTKRNFIASIYVDDSVWSEALLDELFKRKTLYTSLFQEAGMNFRDWTSNHPEARKIFGQAEGKDPPLQEKVLGMSWDVVDDSLSVNADKVKELSNGKLKTKRHLWKLVPSIYDPIGLVSPYVQVGKGIISRACEEVKGWDSPLPQKYIDEARNWAAEFKNLGNIKFHRHCGVENPKKLQLIGCCDASKRALGACVYLLSTKHDNSKVCNLILSKSRLAPKVKHSIPRMEILSAVLLINIMKHVRVAYPEIPESDIYWFSDSADVIFWLYSGHLSWKPFVANQVQKIRKASLVQNWRHIDSSENPADLPSRGTKLRELDNNLFWKHGPEFWCNNLDSGKSKLVGYNKHYKNLELSPSCKAEMKPDIKNQLGISTVVVSSIVENDREISDEVKSEFKSCLKNNIDVCPVTLDIVQGVTKNRAGFQNVVCPAVESTFIADSSDPVVDYPQVNTKILGEDISEPTFGFPRMDKIINFQSLRRTNFSSLLYDHLIEVTDTVLKAASKFLSVIGRKLVPNSMPQDKLSCIARPSEIFWIQTIQRKHFPDIFKLVKNTNAQVSSSSRSLFVKHSVFLDTELNILRCTTCNELSALDYATVYPILLPSTVRNTSGTFENCKFVEMLVNKAHEHCGHQGVPNTLAYLRSEFWILQGRRFVQKILHKCVTCCKVQGPFYSVPPAPPLPEFRVLKSRPWRGTGLDYLGHFWCKDEKGSKFKAWLILYTCGVTRAIHLEAVRSRSVKDFLDANSRFMDSEGIPLSFISDHEGAFKKGSILYEQVAKSSRVRKEFNKNRISWNFYTEKSPNKGGFIERLNAIVKRVVYKVLGRRTPTFEEFRTLAVNAKAVVNDRPLTYLFSDINSEYKALSPSMLLRGRNLGEVEHLNLGKIKECEEEEEKIGEKYFYQEKVKNAFWNQWYQCYLKDLFERHARQKKAQKSLLVPKLGEVVLVFEGDKVPRRLWRMGKIVEIGDVKRGSVRQCTVQMLSPSGKTLTKLKRPPEQLVPLEIDSSNEIFGVDSLMNLEGDPRETSSQSSTPTKYSKKQLAIFKKSKIWPPYSVSQRFFDTSACNTGPEKNFIHKVFKEDENAPRSFGPRRNVTFQLDEEI